MAITDSDIVGWWDIEEGSGSTVDDEVGTNNGTITGATWTTGGPTNLANGLDFDGVNDILDFNFNPNTTDGCIAVWFKATNNTASPSELIFGEGGLGGGGGADIFVSPTGLRGRVRMGGVDRDVTWTSGAGFSTATLYLAILNWADGASGSLELFANDSSKATLSGSLGTQNGGSVDLAAGNNPALSRDFDGQIYQCILFNRNLNSSERADLYNSGDGTTYSQLLGGSTFTPKVMWID